MADITLLAQHLQDTGLDTRTHHELLINFPACELLPSGKRPHLNTPRDIGYRELPPAILDPRETSDIDFYHLIPVTRSGSEAALAPYDPNAHCLIFVMQRLGAAAGKSTLDVVAWLDTDGQLIHHIKVSTIFELQGRQVQELREVEYRGRDYLDTYKTEPWMELLVDLMEIASARAFIHVMDKLLEYDEEFGEQQAARWYPQWNRLRAPTVSELLCQFLRTSHYESDGRAYTQSMRHPDRYPIYEHLNLVYPCGHSDRMLVSTLVAISPTQCLDFACLDCNQRILDRTGRHLLDLGQQREARALFLELYTEMHRNETEDGYLERSAMLTDTATMLRALELALVSFQAPKSVTPRALCPSALPEMRPVLAALRHALQGPATPLALVSPRTLSSYQLYVLLMDLAVYSLKDTDSRRRDGVQVMSPRFATFLSRWIRRAVAYAVRDRDAEAERGVDDMVESLNQMSLPIENGEASSSSRG